MTMRLTFVPSPTHGLIIPFIASIYSVQMISFCFRKDRDLSFYEEGTYSETGRGGAQCWLGET